MTFIEKLNKSITQNNSLVCVGLDTDETKIPQHLKKEDYAIFEFNKEIIDATQDLVCAYKPNIAFYEAIGNKGIVELRMTCEYIQQKYAEIPIILDAKRGDIGNTNNGYAKYIFDYLQADAITVNPYLGKEALQPFLKHKDKGIIILCKTSNNGGGEFQNLKINNEPLYKIVAKNVAAEWNNLNNCLLVVGATYPEELKEIRAIVGDMPILVPGIGAQGGDVEKTIKAGINSKNSGLIINSSRAIIYASTGEDFAQKAREETLKLKEQINKFRN
jgi:orotidine-5'-phosphate decarboxylase